MFNTEKIAILLAAYNGEKYIEGQINSLLGQSYTEWELYIHDDGSKDRTREIINTYAKKYPDRIHVLNATTCGGAKENFFFMLRQVQAPYIMFCDQDDIWLRDKIETTLAQMQSTEEQMGAEIPVLVFSDLSIADRRLNILAERMSKYQKLNPNRVRPENLIIQNVITGCTVMINRTLAELAVKPENTDKIIMHDWWCALIAADFGKISFVNRPLVLYRQHDNNTIGAKKLNKWSYIKGQLHNGSDIRTSLLLKQKQSAKFAETYRTTNPLFQEFGMLNEKKKLQRILFYIKRRIYFCGWQRNLGLLIWG